MNQRASKTGKPPRIKSKHQQVAGIEAEMLHRVRARGGLSRVELARELKLAPSTVGIYVDRLVRDRFLSETEFPERQERAGASAGRPATALVPNPDGGRFIGVDLEARNLMATSMDFSQQALRQVHIKILPSETGGQIVAKIEQAIDETIAGDDRPVLGIGLGLPGTFDPAAGLAVRYDLIPDWHDLALGDRLASRYNAPVFLENNIRSMALAELWPAGRQELRDFVCVGIRSGVAAGVVVGRRLVRGALHRAGEIGHWVCPVPPALCEGVLIRSGNPWQLQTAARLERVASIPAIVACAERGVANGKKTCLADLQRDLAIDDVIAAAHDGDRFALSLVESVGCIYGWVAHQLHELFDPEKIIFAGPLADLGALFLATVCENARQFNSQGRVPAIETSTLGRYNGAVGAAALALEHWKPKR